ncbi:MAG: Crp/Fnr family transcriptional regulator [Flavobacteriales bacterium]|nr:Crp/Fnr family transcriptional regulator [Flavobacteriales bacterium]
MGNNTSEEELFGFSLFNVLSDTERKELWKSCRCTDRMKGDFLFSENPNPDFIYFVIDGMVLQGCSLNSKNMINGIVGAGQICYVGSIAGNSSKSSFAVVRSSKARVVSIPKSLMMSFTRVNVRFQEKIMDQAFDYIKQLEHFLMIASLPSRNRVVEILKLLALNHGRYASGEVVLKGKFSHVFLAEVGNTARQSVTQVMNQLKEEDQICYDRNEILIRNLETLS